MSKRKNKVDNYSRYFRIGFVKRTITFLSLYSLWFIRRKSTRAFLFKQFFAPKSYKISESEKQYLKDGRRFEIIVNEQKVVYWKWGAGPIVIFSHGWNGRGIQFNHFFDKLVKNDFTVVAFDGPGHGESEGKTCSYFQMTDTIRAFVKHFSLENIQGIVGHSFGASAIINALSKEKLQLPVVLIAPAIKLKEMLEKTIQMHGVPNIIFKSLIAEYEKKYGYHFINDNPHNLLKSLKLNALILHDFGDQTTPFSISQETATLYEYIDLIKTEGLGHIRILKDDAVIDKTIAYLNTFNSDLNGVNNIKNKESVIHTN